MTPLSLAIIQHARLIKATLADNNGEIMTETKANCRINAKISKQNYLNIDELMKKEHLISMRMSKGCILDIALSCLFHALECESLESLAIQHLELIEDKNVDNALAGETA